MRPPGEDLWGYLLDALEEPERLQVHAALVQDESLQQQLEEFRRLLSFLEPARQMPPPPPGLAERTCRWIASLPAHPTNPVQASKPGRQQGQPPVVPSEAAAPGGQIGAVGASPPSFLQPWLETPWRAGFSVPQEVACTPSGKAGSHPGQSSAVLRTSLSGELGRLAGGSSGWRWPDLAALAAVSLLLAMVLFGALHYSRLRQEITQCQENLRRLGGGLIQYSELHQQQFPAIPTEGPLAAAGMYGPILVTGGFVQDQGAFWCPGAVRQGITPAPIPTLVQLQRIEPKQQQALLPRLGGAYGYSLGYVESGQYRPPRNRHRSYFALLADAPNPEHPHRQSFHHGGGGQNVLFEDGHVEFVSGCRLPISQDHFFLNHQGILAPGIGPDDAVVAPPNARPLVPPASQPSQ